MIILNIELYVRMQSFASSWNIVKNINLVTFWTLFTVLLIQNNSKKMKLVSKKSVNFLVLPKYHKWFRI